MLVRDHEKLQMWGAWGGASLYVIVDLFLALTGFLSALPLLAGRGSGRGKPESPCSCCECCGLRLVPLRRKFWRIAPPYFAVLAAAAVAFAGDRTWPRAYTRSEALHRIDELFGPGMEWQSTSLSTVWANVFHANALALYGGFLIHTWSLSLQYLFYLWFPALWKILGLGKGMRLPAMAALVAMAHGAGRLGMWLRLRSFGGATDLSGYLHFSFYVALLARVLPFWLGAAAAWAVQRAPRGVARLRGGSGLGWAARIGGVASLAAVLAGNGLWEYTLGHPEEHGGLHQAAFYVLGKPGGTLSAVAFAWVLLAAVADVPILLPAAGARRASGFTSCLSSRRWALLSSASYWLYLLHPVLFGVGMSQPHFLMPASEARLPVPTGFGLAIPRQALALEHADHPLSPWQSPTVAGVTNSSAAVGWRPRYQDHWLMRRAEAAGLPQAERLSGAELGAGAWAVIGLGVAVAIAMAFGLSQAVEPACRSAMRRLWAAFPALGAAVDGLVDGYHAVLFFTLPVLHILMHGVWFFVVTPELEEPVLGGIKASAAETAAAQLIELSTREHAAYGPRAA